MVWRVSQYLYVKKHKFCSLDFFCCNYFYAINELMHKTNHIHCLLRVDIHEFIYCLNMYMRKKISKRLYKKEFAEGRKVYKS